jgi:ParB family transcriptional regulator, chromosome partitioning protein
MKLQHIELSKLKLSPINVRKHGGKDVDDLVASIRSLGVIQPLLVRPNCDGFEVIAGQRRLLACQALAQETGKADPVPCAVLESGDDAVAIEASLAENVARLPMDEIDQYEAFAALRAKDRSIADIAGQFGVTELLVKRRLAIAELIDPILNAYRKGDIDAETLRQLTMATKTQQKAWFKLFRDPKQHAPTGKRLKAWLFGGAEIPVSSALFPPEQYGGAIVSDLFGEERYFDDAQKFVEAPTRSRHPSPGRLSRGRLERCRHHGNRQSLPAVRQGEARQEGGRQGLYLLRRERRDRFSRGLA